MRAFWIGTALGVVLTTAACDRADPPVAATTTKQPTQVLENFELNDVQSGTTTMKLQAIESRVYEQDQFADVDRPHVLFYKAGHLSSTMDAPAGRIFLQTHAMEAWGGVTLVSSDSATLTSDRMRYDPQKKKILSDDPVRLEKPDSVTEGKSLEADPDLKSVKIGHQKVTMKRGEPPR